MRILTGKISHVKYYFIFTLLFLCCISSGWRECEHQIGTIAMMSHIAVSNSRVSSSITLHDNRVKHIFVKIFTNSSKFIVGSRCFHSLSGQKIEKTHFLHSEKNLLISRNICLNIFKKVIYLLKIIFFFFI